MESTTVILEDCKYIVEYYGLDCSCPSSIESPEALFVQNAFGAKTWIVSLYYLGVYKKSYLQWTQTLLGQLHFNLIKLSKMGY